MELPTVTDVALAMKVEPTVKSGNRQEYAVPLDTPWLANFKTLSDEPMRFASILVALTSDEHQEEHQDDPSDNGERVIVYLTDVTSAADGAVEVSGKPQLGNRGTVVKYSTLDMHRGLANQTTSPRIALGLAFSKSDKPVFTIGNSCPSGFLAKPQLSQDPTCQSNTLTTYNSCRDACVNSPTCTAFSFDSSSQCYSCTASGNALEQGSWIDVVGGVLTCIRTSSFGATTSSTLWSWLTFVFFGTALYLAIKLYS